MRNEKQRNGIKIIYYRWRYTHHLSWIELFVNKEREIREKILKNFDTETSLKKLKPALPHKWVVFYRISRSSFTKFSIHNKWCIISTFNKDFYAITLFLVTRYALRRYAVY